MSYCDFIPRDIQNVCQQAMYIVAIQNNILKSVQLSQIFHTMSCNLLAFSAKNTRDKRERICHTQFFILSTFENGIKSEMNMLHFNLYVSMPYNHNTKTAIAIARRCVKQCHRNIRKI